MSLVASARPRHRRLRRCHSDCRMVTVSGWCRRARAGETATRGRPSHPPQGEQREKHRFEGGSESGNEPDGRRGPANSQNPFLLMSIATQQHGSGTVCGRGGGGAPTFWWPREDARHRGGEERHRPPWHVIRACTYVLAANVIRPGGSRTPPLEEAAPATSVVPCVLSTVSIATDAKTGRRSPRWRGGACASAHSMSCST